MIQVNPGLLGYTPAMPQNIDEPVEILATALRQRGLRVCTAESCTGGLIAKTFTDLAGSSDWFDRGFVTYSNAAKAEMLGVPESLIEDYGAVSEPVANAMASGALLHSAAEFAVAVTGVAGPGGGSADKPVGTVWIALASKGYLQAWRYQFQGDRAAVREATLIEAVEQLLSHVNQAG